MKLSLVVLSEGKATGKTIPVTLSQFIIGRDPQCQLRPASPLISKRHCALIARSDKYFIRDFGSTNGTFINDEAVKGERQLQHDDILRVGPLTFRIVIEGRVAVNKPTPPPKNLNTDKHDDSPVAAVGAATDSMLVAGMLLDLAADEGPSTASAKSEDSVPDGTTVMEMPSPFPPSPEEAAQQAADKTKRKQPEAKEETGNTSEAAKAILQKYTRRSRK